VLAEERIAGCLLGTAVADALGLPYEGMSPSRAGRRYLRLQGRVRGYSLVGSRGYVSDDTEQSALVAQALCAGRDDVAAIVRRFRRSLLGWFLRLPFGIGFATLRACVKIGLGLSQSGVNSAGNGAAMRSMIVGAVFDDNRAARVAVARALASVTHSDERAVAAAVFVADVAAGDIDALAKVEEPALRARLERAADLADDVGEGVVDGAVRELGTSGFVLESVPFAYFCFLRFGASFRAVEEAIKAGGDADTNAAIVGGWVGAWDPTEIPNDLVAQLSLGPFGARHLRALARALSTSTPPPSWSPLVALLRNLALYPVVLAHGFRRLLPF
jgi:ADP-ribosyl-[dinitrogen reductase] hydrolase